MCDIVHTYPWVKIWTLSFWFIGLIQFYKPISSDRTKLLWSIGPVQYYETISSYRTLSKSTWLCRPIGPTIFVDLDRPKIRLSSVRLDLNPNNPSNKGVLDRPSGRRSKFGRPNNGRWTTEPLCTCHAVDSGRAVTEGPAALGLGIALVSCVSSSPVQAQSAASSCLDHAGSLR